MTDITDKEAQHLHRLILFSDAVFAIAITLLAIEIHPPEHWSSVGDLLSQMRHKLMAYAVSFAVVGVNWIAHRRTFSRLRRADGVLDVLNLLMLGLLALLPLGTEMLWENGTASSVVVYVALVTAIGLAHALAWGYAAMFAGLSEPMPTGEKVYVLLRVALLPGLMCGLTFLSIITQTWWGWLGIAVVVAGLSMTNRLMARSGALPAVPAAED
ncbi:MULTISPECIES: TMEM175 family protein [unclassified Caulobacter]|uniref:TMEM175 family protein n=1 Tax=unclassified Caulobacter TaxID=2648921 RepID=UPI0004A749A5|nr:TMEM175 family protein [Caulobacter sp. UNC358MFTsu5.1]